MIQRAAVAAAVVFALARCQHARQPVEVPGGLEVPFDGHVEARGLLHGPAASYSANRIVGPLVNLTRNTDGSWGGWLRGRPVLLTVEGGRIDSPTVSLSIKEDAEGVELSGTWSDDSDRERPFSNGTQLTGIPAPHVNRDMISIRVTPREIFISEPWLDRPVYLETSGPGVYGTGVYADSVELSGTAAMLHPPEPQFALAMLGSF
jgi:hypothetical protein